MRKERKDVITPHEMILYPGETYFWGTVYVYIPMFALISIGLVWLYFNYVYGEEDSLADVWGFGFGILFLLFLVGLAIYSLEHAPFCRRRVRLDAAGIHLEELEQENCKKLEYEKWKELWRAPWSADLRVSVVKDVAHSQYDASSYFVSISNFDVGTDFEKAKTLNYWNKDFQDMLQYHWVICCADPVYKRRSKKMAKCIEEWRVNMLAQQGEN